LVIFQPLAQKPPWTDMHQIWHSCRGHRRNHLWQFMVKGCRLRMGSKLPFPID